MSEEKANYLGSTPMSKNVVVMERKQPFNPRVTSFPNSMLDLIMREVSANAWKVLCLCMRKTEGWRDYSTESGRKESDVISLSQFMEFCGIKSEVTVREAIDECISKGYLIRQPEGQSFRYRLNKEYELHTPYVGVSTPTENMGVPEITPTENMGVTPTENMDTNNNLINNKEHGRSLEEHKEQTRASLQKFYARQEKGGADMYWLDEGLIHFAEAFTRAFGVDTAPLKSERKLWRKVLLEWQSIGLTDDIIERTVAEMRRQNLNIAGPQSVTNMARNLMAKQSQGQMDMPPVFRASESDKWFKSNQ